MSLDYGLGTMTATTSKKGPCCGTCQNCLKVDSNEYLGNKICFHRENIYSHIYIFNLSGVMYMYHIRYNCSTYPYKRTVKQFHSLQITASVPFVYFFIKAYAVGTHLNCIDLLM